MLLKATFEVLTADTKSALNKSHLGGKISLRLELLKEGGQEEGGEEKDDGPEENIWDVGPMMTAGRTHKFPMEYLTHLETKEY